MSALRGLCKQLRRADTTAPRPTRTTYDAELALLSYRMKAIEHRINSTLDKISLMNSRIDRDHTLLPCLKHVETAALVAQKIHGG
ncbi:hypothetical protein ZWY2020_048722 [Hordeum vulgare]|nr:hypothetical protein ZWY2020_048722 [Hordeum vulgare]